MRDIQLAKDVIELSNRLRKFYEFYYALIEAKYISLNITDFKHQDTIEVIQVDKAEWDRWQKVKNIINDFEVSN